MKIHGSPWQAAGIPDIIGCYRGYFISFEVKRPGGKATPLQEYTMKEITTKGGGISVVISTVEEVVPVLDRIDGAEEVAEP